MSDKIYLVGQYTDENKPRIFTKDEAQRMKECRHPVASSRFLTAHDTPHTSNPHLMAVKVLTFLCEECGSPFSIYHETPRAIPSDGNLPTKMMEGIEEIQREKDVQRRLKEELAKGDK